MSMHVPERTQVTQKPLALARRKPGPQLRRDRAQVVHDLAPIQSRRRAAPDFVPKPAEQSPRAARLFAQHRRSMRRRRLRRRAMRLRQQPAPRHGDHRPAMPAPCQAERDVDHRQSRPHEQQRIIGPTTRQRALRPWVGNPARLVSQNAVGERSRWQVPQCQHDAIGAHRPAAGQLDLCRFAARRQSNARRVVAVQMKLGDAAIRLARGAQHVFEVFPIPAARQKLAAVDVRVAPPRPRQKVIRRIGQPAHSPGRNVQQMCRTVGRVGHAAADRRAPLDQVNACWRPPAEELRGEQRPAAPAADDRDRGRHAGTAIAALRSLATWRHIRVPGSGRPRSSRS